MTNKYRGVCHDCGHGVPARGGTITKDGARWLVFCAECRADRDEAGGDDEDSAAGFEPGTLAWDRALARRGLSVVRFASGHVMTQNSRGRCEDAPCCGCCS